VNIFERAKNIRLKGESWQNCIQRAKAQVNYELQLGGEGKERKTKNRIRSDIPFVYSKGPTMRTSRKSGRKKVGKGCVLNISEDSDHEGWCISREEAEKHNIKYLADSDKVCKTSRKRRTGNVTCRRRRNSRGELLGSDLPKPRLSEKQKKKILIVEVTYPIINIIDNIKQVWYLILKVELEPNIILILLVIYVQMERNV
jgi:hypothetical protein